MYSMSYIQITGHQLFIKIHSKISSDELYLKLQFLYKLRKSETEGMHVYVCF